MCREKRGFTLAELLVVVAIIAVLVAVAVPVFNASLEKSRAAVCLANRRSLYGELAVRAIDGDSTVDEEFEKLGGDELNEFACPDGGVFSAGDQCIRCSVHSGALTVDLSGQKVTLGSAVKEFAFENGTKQSFYEGELYYSGGTLYYVAARCTNYTITGSSLENLTGTGYLKAVDSAKTYTVGDISSDGKTCGTYYGVAQKGGVYNYNGVLYVQVGSITSGRLSCDPADSPGIWTLLGTVS